MRMRDPHEIGSDLQRWLKRRRLTEAEFALRVSRGTKGLSVSQSWISRIARGQFSRLTPTVRRVTGYASIPVMKSGPSDAKGAELIDKAVTDVWNGSFAHANVIARLIRVAKSISSQEKQ